VLFADIVSSTRLIEGLDPEDAYEILQPTIRIMMDAVHRFGGTVNLGLGRRYHGAFRGAAGT